MELAEELFDRKDFGNICNFSMGFAKWWARYSLNLKYFIYSYRSCKHYVGNDLVYFVYDKQSLAPKPEVAL